MKIWSKANTLSIISASFLIPIYFVPKPFNYIFIIPMAYFSILASKQQFLKEIPKPGDETVIDKLVGSVMIFFIIMAIIFLLMAFMTIYSPAITDPFYNNPTISVII